MNVHVKEFWTQELVLYGHRFMYMRAQSYY
jgi:hypothetical protein